MCEINFGKYQASPEIDQLINDPAFQKRLAACQLKPYFSDILQRELCAVQELTLFEGAFDEETLISFKKLGMPNNQIETLISHEHIEDHVEGSTEGILLQGTAFALKLRDKLAPFGEFHIYMVVSQPDAHLTACSVQYHQVRLEEPNWITPQTWEKEAWSGLILTS
jgi:hypothetical protein